MKPPVNIDALVEEWKKDAVIDETEPHRELIKIPILHSKYLHIMTHHNLMVKKIMNDYNKMKLFKIQYFSGDMNNPEDLKEYNLEPILKKILKPDISMHIDADTDLNKILMKKVIHQEIADFCSSVLKELHSRTFQLRSFIDYEKFLKGM
jgi:hypothetical protein